MSTMTLRTPLSFGQQLAVATSLTLVLLTAGCGSPAPDAPAVPPTASSAAVFGPTNRATGETVKVGFFGNGQPGLPPDASLAAVAVAGYANTYLGGLAGHQIETVTCEDEGSQAKAQDCANRFVREGVLAVAASTSGQIDYLVPTLSAAGIPVAINLSSTQTVLQAPGVFVFRNPLTVFGAPAAYARAHRLADAAVLVIDVPGAVGPARALVPTFFANAGSSATVVPIAATVADMTPQVEAVQADSPAMWSVLGNPAFCAAAITAIRKVGSPAPILAADNCLGEDAGATIPGGYAGVVIVASAVITPEDADYALFEQVRHTYGGGTGIDSDGVGGYQGMLSLVRAVNAVAPAELTSASVADALRHAPPTPYPLGGGTTFQCNGQAVPAISPNICSATSFVAVADVDGTMSNFQVVDDQGIYRLS